MAMTAKYLPSVSDHAISRFCERFANVGPELAMELIMTDEVQMWLSWGACRIDNHNGMTVLADRGGVTSVWPAKWYDGRKTKKRNHV